MECVQTIRKETNQRIYERNIPSQPLQPYLDVRPVMTKYAHLPIVDQRKQATVKLTQMPTYNPHAVFNPGNTTSPWSGFSHNVNKESELRNQCFALQKCSQSVYVPKSNSDLYTYAFQPKQVAQPHSLLFEQNKFNPFNPNPNDKTIGTSVFMNSTRCQLKDNNN
jgi:hypothetical protein